jgi:hypothetical protein
MKCSQSAYCLLAHTRVGIKEHLRQDAALVSELTKLLIHRFQQPQWQEMNAHLERQACVIEIAAEFTIKGPDGLQFRRGEKPLRE